MYIEVHDQLGHVVRMKVTRVIAFDDAGNPLSVAVEWQPGAHFLSQVDQPDFNQVLHNLGLNKTVVCTDLDPVPIQEIQFDRRGL